MSVEKMEQYKEYKKHRKEILRKQKRKEKLISILGISSFVLILCVVGILVYQDIKPDYTAKTTNLIDWSQYISDDIIGGEDETEDTTDETEQASSDSSTDETTSTDTTTEGQE